MCCSYKAITERKATKCLDFSYFKLNDLEMTIMVTGKIVVKLFDKAYSYKYLDFNQTCIKDTILV